MNQAHRRVADRADAPSPLLGALYRFVPAFESLRTYSLRVLASDTMAGLTVAAVAVPQAMAYAQIAGIPPQYGLYTAIVMTAVGRSSILPSSSSMVPPTRFQSPFSARLSDSASPNEFRRRSSWRCWSARCKSASRC